MGNDSLISCAEFRKSFGISATTEKALRRRGLLPSQPIKRGRVSYYTREAVKKFDDLQRKQSNSTQGI